MSKIISFSLWGDEPKYTAGALRNAELAELLFPGWTCRYYVATSVPQQVVSSLSSRPNTEIARVNQAGDWTGMFWRFRPCSDPTVEVMLSRDADSRLSMREREAVEQWLCSRCGFHILRDHPQHGTAILGGMWGAKAGALPQMEELIERHTKGDYWQVDQDFLRDVVYPLVKNDALVQDEFFDKCPFPTARQGLEFVGEVYDEHDQPCPWAREELRTYLRSPWKLQPIRTRHTTFWRSLRAGLRKRFRKAA
jgi:hypothetical protein